MSINPHTIQEAIEAADPDQAERLKILAEKSAGLLLDVGYAESITGKIHAAALRGSRFIPGFIKRHFGVMGAADMVVEIKPLRVVVEEMQKPSRTEPWVKTVAQKIETAVLRGGR